MISLIIKYRICIPLPFKTIQLYENDSNSLYESGNGHNYFEFEITIVQNTEYF